MRRILIAAFFNVFLLVVTVSAFSAAQAEGISDQFTYQTINGQVIITNCNWFSALVVIPSEIDGVPVTAIAEGAFYVTSLSGFMSIVIPDSVETIMDDAFNPQCTVIYANVGSAGQDYALSKGIAFGDLAVLFTGNPDILELPQSRSEETEEDPFSVFDNVGRDRVDKAFLVPARLLTDRILTLKLPAPTLADVSPAAAYRARALEKGEKLLTLVNFDPGVGMDSALQQLLYSTHMNVFEDHFEGENFHATTISLGGSIDVDLSWTSTDDALYVGSILLDGDILELDQTAMESLFCVLIGQMAEYSEVFLYDGLSRMESLSSEDSSYFPALFGLDGQMKAFITRMVDQARIENVTDNNPNYDPAVTAMVVNFNQDDLREFLLLPQTYFTINLVTRIDKNIGWGNNPLYEVFEFDDSSSYQKVIDICNNIIEASVCIYFDGNGRVVGGILDADLTTASSASYFFPSMHLTSSLFRKTTVEGTKYALNAALTAEIDNDGQLVTTAPILLEGEWDESQTTCGGLLRLHYEGVDPDDTYFDYGIQYTKNVEGTADSGSETEQLNAYIKKGHAEYGDNINSVISIRSEANISTTIDRTIDFYFDNLSSPWLTLTCTTFPTDEYNEWLSSMYFPEERAINPSGWDVDKLRQYIMSHKQTIDRIIQDFYIGFPGDLNEVLLEIAQ